MFVSESDSLTCVGCLYVCTLHHMQMRACVRVGLVNNIIRWQRLRLDARELCSYRMKCDPLVCGCVVCSFFFSRLVKSVWAFPSEAVCERKRERELQYPRVLVVNTM